MASRQAGMAMPPPGAGPGSMPPSRQQQHQPPPGPSAPSGPPGSLPPGTLVQVGPYTVSVKRYLSQGGFATVYLVNSDRPLPIPTLGGGVRNETLHVLKRIVVPDKEALADVRREVDVHKLLRSDAAVVHFLEASALCLPPPQTGYDVYILMEYCSGGGLLDLLNARLRNRLTEHEVLTIFLDIAKGVAAMHHLDPPVAHRDLKIENILISSEGGKPTYKLCDFGSAKPILSRRAPRSIEELKRLEQDLNKSTTLPYRPPEMVDVYQRRVIDEKADIWALGVLLYKLCYYTTPFEENGGGPLAILNVKYRFPSSPPYGDKVKGLIASLLVDPSHRRPGIDQLIVMVHKALGTKPDAKTLHYAQQAAAGQQLQPLPTVAPSSSSSSSSSAPRALDDEVLIKIASSQRASHNDLAGSGSHDLPSGRSRPASMAIRSSSQRQRPDLISFEPPTAKAASKADETQRLMKLEGIEPMRRGRPGAGANKEEGKAKAGLQPPSGVLGKLQAPPQPRSGSTSPQPPPSATSPAPPSAAATSGFGDSFEPPPATADEKAVAAATQPISPPPASATRQGPVSLGSVDVADSAAKQQQQQQSRAPPQAKEGEGDTSAEGRYPTLEELDRRYPEAKVAAASRASPSSGGAAASGVVASMANRFRTGETGPPSSPSASAASPTSSPSSSSRPTPALPPRKPSGWASNSGSLGRSSTIGSIGSRSQDATSAQQSVKPGSVKDKPVPPPPSAAEKPTLPAPTNGHAKPAESDDEEEEEGPEEAGASGSVRRRWAQYSRDSAPPDSFGVRQSAAPPGRVGKVAAPGWLEDAKKDRIEEAKRPEQPKRKESDAIPPKAPPKPLIDFSAPQAAAPTTASSAKSPPPTSSPSLPTATSAAASPPSSTSTTATSRAPAWAWDGEDEEEVRDWKLAPPIGSPSKELHVGSPSNALLSPMAGVKLDDGSKRDAGLEEEEAKLVDLLAPEPVETQPTTTRSLSPRPTAAAEAPSLPSPSIASARPPSPSKLIPSRARLQEGSRAYRDAATSPAHTALPSPAPSPAPVPNGSPSTATSPVTPGGTSTVAGHPAYAKGTASNLASRWEKMGGAIQSQAPYRGVPQRNGTLPTSSSSAAPGAVGKGRAETLAAPIALPGLAANRPPPSPQPVIGRDAAPLGKPAATPSSTAHLKPWEREELERHEALARFVHAGRSDASPSPPPPARLSPPAARNPRLGGIGAVDITKSASASSSPTPTPGSGESPEQQAAARYKSVASLIDRWQANAGGDKEQQGNVPVQHRGGRVGMEKGWGEIGSRAAGAAAAARERLPGRDV